MKIILESIAQSWHLLEASSIYMLFGILVAGLLRVFLNPGTIANHLGRGHIMPIFKAALLGIPLPL